MSKKTLLSQKPVKTDYRLLQTFLSHDKKMYVFLIKSRSNVRSFVVWDLIMKSVVRYLVHDISRAARRDLENNFKLLPFIDGARALSSLHKVMSDYDEVSS